MDRRRRRAEYHQHMGGGLEKAKRWEC